jgi:uncharacterized OsmC-like protein
MENHVNAEQLRSLQAPFKTKYREDAASAQQTLTARGTLDKDDVVCHVQAFGGTVPAGLHPSAGGSDAVACAGNMLLEALVGCSGVTLKAVATALDIPIRSGTILAEGDMDFRGTLGVSKDVPIGFTAIRLTITLDSDAPQDKIDNLIRLTKRYCVVYQTLEKPPQITTECRKSP